MYKELNKEETFSDTFPTWIIAYCFDTDSFFCTNQRYFWWQYEQEFSDEKTAIEYFQTNINKFKNIRKEFVENCGGIIKDRCVYLENTKEKW